MPDGAGGGLEEDVRVVRVEGSAVAGGGLHLLGLEGDPGVPRALELVFVEQPVVTHCLQAFDDHLARGVLLLCELGIHAQAGALKVALRARFGVRLGPPIDGATLPLGVHLAGPGAAVRDKP